MAYGVFRAEEHIYTYDNELVARKQARMFGVEFYVRELTTDEWYKRMKEIYVEGKYK